MVLISTTDLKLCWDFECEYSSNYVWLNFSVTENVFLCAPTFHLLYELFSSARGQSSLRGHSKAELFIPEEQCLGQSSTCLLNSKSQNYRAVYMCPILFYQCKKIAAIKYVLLLCKCFSIENCALNFDKHDFNCLIVLLYVWCLTCN